MRTAKRFSLAIALAITCATGSAISESPEEWVTLGSRIHGGFGTLIPVGIRIGLDALQRLEAKPREVTVTYYSGSKAPCPCIADGIMLATMSSPGQGSLVISPEMAPPEVLGTAVIRSKKTGEGLRYTVSSEWLPKLLEWNKTYDPLGRYDVVMKADNLFSVEREQKK
jgi:formylmethanofuran dehydrogenase subunit E